MVKRRRSPAHVEKLLDAVISISQCSTFDEACALLLEAALDLTRIDGGSVYSVENGTAEIRYHRGLPEAFISEAASVPLRSATIQELLDIEDSIEVTLAVPSIRDALQKHGVRHVYSFPFVAQNTLFGFLTVGSTNQEAPDESDIQALHVLVSQMEALLWRLYCEKAIHRSEQRYRTLMQSARDGITLHEWSAEPEKGRFIDANDYICRMLGYTQDELLRISPLQLTDPERSDSIPELVARIVDQGTLLYETVIVAKDGRRIPVEVNTSLTESDGRKVAVSVIRDVTERLQTAEALRESEERYRSLAETAQDFIFVLDLEGRIQYVNAYGANALGCTPDELQGRPITEIFSPEASSRQKENLDKVIAYGVPLSVVDLVRLYDRPLWLTTQLTPVRGPHGEIRSVLGISRDITQMKELEQQLRQLNESLETQVEQRTEELTRRASQLQRLTVELSRTEERERERLAMFLHNDLQQVLASAKFHLSLLSPGDLRNKDLEAIVEKVTRMIEGAMEQSRSLSHELSPPYLHSQLLNRMFEWLAHEMNKKHGLFTRMEINEPVSSDSEPVRILLYRSAQEILFNVAKHSGVHEAELRLQRFGNELWLTISDRGRGFDPCCLSHKSGFGLLSIRERIELLGGDMKISSSPGRGSTFRIRIPDPVEQQITGSGGSDAIQ